MKTTWIKNARIVNEGETFEGSVIIAGENIVEVLKGTQAPSIPYNETIDANGYYLIPGVIDDPERFSAILLSHALWDVAVFIWFPI